MALGSYPIWHCSAILGYEEELVPALGSSPCVELLVFVFFFFFMFFFIKKGDLGHLVWLICYCNGGLCRAGVGERSPSSVQSLGVQKGGTHRNHVHFLPKPGCWAETLFSGHLLSEHPCTAAGFHLFRLASSA